MRTRKKLIEVALPLEAINIASAREKSIRHGHPSTLHLWWARRPLAAARAVIFAQMVDDPSAYVDVLRADPKLRRKAEIALKARLKLWEETRALSNKATGSGLSVPEPGPAPTLDDMLADEERQRLFGIIEKLVLWENTTSETVLQSARNEIWQSWRRACAENADHPRAKELFDRKKLPAFHDPFAGGGALPLEAQRLGLESYASDLNPVAVLINKAMIEIPPKFTDMPPVNPDSQRQKTQMDKSWQRAQGLADDVRYYGQWMRDEAERRIGHLYPKVEITATMAKERRDLKPYAGKSLTVIAWLWARTVKSPNPAFAHIHIPLASTFILSARPGSEAFVELVVDDDSYHFVAVAGKPRNMEVAKRGTKLARGAHFRCAMSGMPIDGDYIKAEAMAGRLGTRLMAMVAEGDNGRVFLSPSPEMEKIASAVRPTWIPDTPLPDDLRNFWIALYGFKSFGDLFTPRQLLALTTFSDLVEETRKEVIRDQQMAGMPDDGKRLSDGGNAATAYADAIAVYAALAVSKASDLASTICHWQPNPQHLKIAPTFSRHTLPMSWDFAEGNPFSDSSGNFNRQSELIAQVLEVAACYNSGSAVQADASTQSIVAAPVVSTDPPYYDNISYADLSDYFYLWLRRCLRSVFPQLLATLAVPKAEELIAAPHRQGTSEAAGQFFLEGMTKAMQNIGEHCHPDFPITIYYAFKQAESEAAGGASTGWETFLEAVIRAGMAVTGTWPIRTERQGRMIAYASNALASSIVLVCRLHSTDAPTATRREFVSALKSELPAALANLQRGNIAPVDLAQAAIGPGMAVYTRYAKVLGAGGKALSVREALALINQTLDEALAEQEGDFDADSRWALTWFEQSGFDEGEYGVAETLATARNTSVSGLVEARVVLSRRGKVRLLRPEELPAAWDPATDPRLTAWETVHQLIRVLATGGEGAAAELVAKLGVKAEIARELAYRLYTFCERKKRATEALAYNGLIQSWPEITRLAREVGKPRTEQGGLFQETEE